MSVIDETHDPRLESWVASARGHAEFPIQNLPFGIFTPSGGGPRGGVAIGDAIFDLRAGLEAGLFTGEPARAASSITNSSSPSGSGPATRSASRSRSLKPAIISLGSVSSMTGRRATSSNGNRSHWDLFSARVSAAPSRPGSLPPRHWRRSAPSSRRGRPAIRARCLISGTRRISARAPLTSRSKLC